MKPGDESQANPPGYTQTHLAWLRTRMSLERSMDAWIRTAVALIGFGISIVLFFEQLNQIRGLATPKGAPLANYVGLLLIGTGTLALAIAVWQYEKLVRYLQSEVFRDIAGVPGMRRLYPSLAVAALLCLVGLLAFVAVLLRM